jgi:hypothetical protein
VVEFDPPSSDSHPIPEPLDYPKVLKPDSKMLESIAFHAGGNEERFIKLCHRCNVTPSWWTEDGCGKVYYSFKSTSRSFNELISGSEYRRVEPVNLLQPVQVHEEPFPKYIAVGEERRVFKIAKHDNDNEEVKKYRRRCSGDTVHIVRDKDGSFVAVEFNGVNLPEPITACSSNRGEWESSDNNIEIPY